MTDGAGEKRQGLERATWAIIGAMAAATLAWLPVADLALDRRGLVEPGLAGLSMAAGLFAWRVRWPDEKLAALLASMLHLFLFTAFAGCLQYLVAGLRLPLWDHTFHAWDAALGLDWRAYLAFVDARPPLAEALTLAYRSLIPQIAAVCVVVGLSGRLAALRTFTFAFTVSGLVCVLISGLMPAMTAYAHLGLGPADHPHLVPALADAHVAHLGAVRGGTFGPLSPAAVEGIIAFPSFHATLGVLLIAAFWSVPFLRWPACLLNLGLVAATPLLGGHYFVDVFAGLLLGLGTLALANAVAARDERGRAGRPEAAPDAVADGVGARGG